MSTFQVRLTNQYASSPIEPLLGQAHADITGQGNLDENAQQTGTSVQRTAYIMGPNKINRKLTDGETFTDCNYWLRFAPVSEGGSVADVNQAFIHVVSNDGSVYIDGEESVFPRIYSLTVTATTFGTSVVDVLGDNGGPAEFTTIEVDGSGSDVVMEINGLATAVRTITAGTSLSYDKGDLSITRLDFKVASGTGTVLVTVGVASVCYS